MENLLNIGTLNCRGLYNNNLKERQISQDMIDYKLDFLCVQETHIRGKGIIELDSFKYNKYKLYYSGLDESDKTRNFTGVGIICKPDFKCNFTAVSDRNLIYSVQKW